MASSTDLWAQTADPPTTFYPMVQHAYHLTPVIAPVSHVYDSGQTLKSDCGLLYSNAELSSMPPAEADEQPSRRGTNRRSNRRW